MQSAATDELLRKRREMVDKRFGAAQGGTWA
jgi:hypothetical protein